MISPLCDQTVTVFRRVGERAVPSVLENCCLNYYRRKQSGEISTQEETDFLLVAPGEADIRPGDRILPGVQEEQDWDKLIPACVPGLCQAAYVQVCYRNGEVSHVEAGRGQNGRTG